MSPNAAKSYVCTMNAGQIIQLETTLRDRGWMFKPIPYGHWQAAFDKTSVSAYLSGKVTVQGKNTADLVLFTLEPEILKTSGFGYNTATTEPADELPKTGHFQPHAGIDESGKGDFFGPLVIAAVYVDDKTLPEMKRIGVRDSKTIKSSKQIAAMAAAIRDASEGKFSVVTIGPEAYNRLYGQIKNLNRLLAWGHARAIENILEKVPDCPRMLSDKFGSEHLIRNALLKKGKTVILEQQVRAESDVAVAAASILARDGFLFQMNKLSKQLDMELPRGAGAVVDTVARDIAAQKGIDILDKYAKTHFKTMEKITQ
jgi:ribonuclease HIII